MAISYAYWHNIPQNTPKLTILGCFWPLLCTMKFEIELKLLLCMQYNCISNMTLILRDFMKFLVQNTPKLAILN